MVNSMFTISTNDEAVLYLCARDKKLSTVINEIGDLVCSIHTDPFAFIIGEIVGQMLSNKVARVLSERLVNLCNGQITEKTLLSLSFEEIRSIGLSRAKVEYITSFAKSVQEGQIDLRELENFPDDVVMKRLTTLRGIGTWTAKMYLLFVLCRQDILPYEDGAFLQSFSWLYGITEKPTRKMVEEMCNSWHPYSSIASRYMYRALDMGLTKEPFESLIEGAD